jgi:hypothetical protein
MFAIAQKDDSPLLTGSGLIVHDGPTINAGRLRVLPWGSVVELEPTPWVEFPQLGRPSWMWYKLAGTDDWIAGRISSLEEDDSIIFSYLIGANADHHPCENLPEFTGNVTFEYNRALAAQVAIYQSENNESLSGADYPYYRVTHRVGTRIPFADFSYTSTFQNRGTTGSGVFMSEMLWMGGLPMSVFDGSYSLCENGWRICFTTGSSNYNYTRGWRLHDNIIEYFTTADVPYPLADEDVNDTLDLLNAANLGNQILAQNPPENGSICWNW